MTSHSDHVSDPAFDLTAEDEAAFAMLIAVEESAPFPPSARTSRVPFLPPPPPRFELDDAISYAPGTTTVASSPRLASTFVPHGSAAVGDILNSVTEDDLDFDLSELDGPVGRRDGGRADGGTVAARPSRSDECPENGRQIRLSPSVTRRYDPHLASFVAQTRPRSVPTAVLPHQQDAGEDLGPEDHDSDHSQSAGDTRSPLLRFRTFPRKPFSVSDLTAGQWCELQYLYTLTHLPGGKRTRTEAMEQGSRVHKKLERQIFRPVQVKVTKKEDAFGLRLWNIIQGLRTLRDTGITRELEVWGVIEGSIVCGCIDLLTHKNPDPELQEKVLSSQADSQEQPRPQPQSQPDQKHINDYFRTPQNTTDDVKSHVGNQQVYITDVKTRATAKLPRAARRGPILQLFLYHRMLSDMASDQLDYEAVFQRYGMRADETFSDAFLAQMAVLYDELFFDARTSVSAGGVSADGGEGEGHQLRPRLEPPDLLRYASLRALVVLLKDELRRTFPRGADTIGQIVAVEYRYRGHTLLAAPANQDVPAEAQGDEAVAVAVQDQAVPAEGGRGRIRSISNSKDEVILVRAFFVDPPVLEKYLREDMEWWRGERPPRGVPPEEAFKCGHCEFAEGCEWRRNMEAEVLEKVREKVREKGRAKQRERLIKTLGSKTW